MSSTQDILQTSHDNSYSLENSQCFKDPEDDVKKAQNFWEKHKRFLIHCIVFCIISCYFTWATWYYIENTGEPFNTTLQDGYGFLVIIYCIYLYGLWYYCLIKPYAFPVLNTSIGTTTNYVKKIRYGPQIFYSVLLAGTIVYLIYDTRYNRTRLIPFIGLCTFLLVGLAMCSNRPKIPWNTIIWGMILQFVFGFLTIRLEVGRNILETFSDKVNIFMDYGIKGARFTYGDDLIDNQVFAFCALSVIFLIGFVVNLLYYYGLMQKFVSILGEFLQYILGTSICESVNSVAVVFVGMSEGPMMLRPYLKHLTDSEIHSMMLAGFASVSGSTLAAYINYGARPQDLITASIMSAPAALCFSKLIYPETQPIKIKKKNIHLIDVEYSSAMDAASRGATDAFHLIAAIISGVTACLSFVYFINGVLSWCGLLVGFSEDSNKWTLDNFAGKIFMPVSWIMGVQWDECEKVGQLIGVKTMVNEFVAFQRMQTMGLTLRSKVIATYAICGFSNPGSIGIALSTMAALVPEKKEAVSRLVFRAFVGGALVCLMTACIAGILMPDDVLTDGSSSNSTLIGNATIV